MEFEKDKARLGFVRWRDWDMFTRIVERYTTIKSGNSGRVIVASGWDLDIYTNTLVCCDRYFI